MADNRALVVMAFNPANGMVSINGGAWRKIKIMKKARVDKPPQQPSHPKPQQPAATFPPPGEGDDDIECLLCFEHGQCHIHVWDGSTWLDLGGDCWGAFCQM